MTEDRTGLELAFGAAEDGMSWVGRRLQRRAEVPVNDAMIRNYCSLVEDSNPDYWERGVSPPGMLMAWMMPLPWRPGAAHRRSGLFALDIPLPGHHIINVSTDTEFYLPLQRGDHVECVEQVTAVSPPKRTRLGEGHFIETVSTFSAGGRDVARNANLLYRYDTESVSSDTDADHVSVSDADPSGPAMLHSPGGGRSVTTPSPAVGDQLPEVDIDVSYHRVVLNAAATWDWFPGHHNPFYARSQGQRTIYLSTLFFHGFVDRFVTDWAGSGAAILRRKISMRRSIYAGETATARGQVAATRKEREGLIADIEASVDGPAGPCVFAEISVRLPRIAHG